MGIVVVGAVFVDVKGYPDSNFIPTGRNAGRVEHVHGGVGRNVVEDIANCELRPTFVSLVDESGDGLDVIRKLQNHKINTDFVWKTRDGMGTWLAVFNNDGDVHAGFAGGEYLSDSEWNLASLYVKNCFPRYEWNHLVATFDEKYMELKYNL